jgi:hypothetical protein
MKLQQKILCIYVCIKIQATRETMTVFPLISYQVSLIIQLSLRKTSKYIYIQ